MIISKQYDEALFLILKSDKKNRKDILSFLNFIPKELFHELQNIIYINRDSKALEPYFTREYKIKNAIINARYVAQSYICIEKRSVSEENTENITLILSISKDYKGAFIKSNVENLGKSSYCIRATYDIVHKENENFIIVNTHKKREQIKNPKKTQYYEDKIPKNLTLKYINSNFNKK